MPDNPGLHTLKHHRVTQLDVTSEDGSSPTNVQRANQVLESLEIFAKRTGQVGEDADTNIGDFLASLMHLCRINDLDFDDILDRSRRRHSEEAAGL